MLASRTATHVVVPPAHRPSIAFAELSRIHLLSWGTGVIHVMTAQSVAPRRTIMKTFTIDNENNITAFPTQDQAEAAAGAGSQSFTSQKQLAALASAWPTERLMEVWNSLPGVEPVKGFKSVKAAASRIWARIQTLGEVPEPKAPTKAKVAKQARHVAPAKPKSAKKTTPAKKATKPPKKAAKPKAEGPREGTKTAQVVAMLQRKNGATLEEIMAKMSWQKHTVRGFMAGAMKKAGFTVESFKSEKGERTYRINA
jgi:hypothetical protein